MNELKLPTSVKQIGPVKVQLSRQQLRRIGQRSTLAGVNHGLKSANRRERRAFAKQLHKQAWDKRDKQLVTKITQGYTRNK